MASFFSAQEAAVRLNPVTTPGASSRLNGYLARDRVGAWTHRARGPGPGTEANETLFQKPHIQTTATDWRVKPQLMAAEPPHFETLRRIHREGLFQQDGPGTGKGSRFQLPEEFRYLAHNFSPHKYMKGFTSEYDREKVEAWHKIKTDQDDRVSAFLRELDGDLTNTRFTPMYPGRKLQLQKKVPQPYRYRKRQPLTARTFKEAEREAGTSSKRSSRSSRRVSREGTPFGKPINDLPTCPDPPEDVTFDPIRLEQLQQRYGGGALDSRRISQALSPPKRGAGFRAERPGDFYDGFPYAVNVDPEVAFLQPFQGKEGGKGETGGIYNFTAAPKMPPVEVDVPDISVGKDGDEA